ncbi:MAG: TonB-dependent receptor plug domain-containing protein, partial [Bacteroidales bacterium]|nr:TonB-dependent receptor plug domain-containing protein [Bacteroidales bacterium]
IGYRPVTLSVRGRDKMNVSLEPDRTILDEAVVVGYGTMKRSDLTGSVSSVGAKAIESFKTGTVLEALGGQIAGVNITAADGTPGGDFDIKIRGVGTVNGDSSPLYIVDGFEVDNISFLANQDIASIDVLKDASASAIYGARAANGVVLVTTKSGRNGRTEVSYNGSASYRTLSRQLDVLDPYEFVKLQLELNPTRYADRYFKVGEDANGKAYRFQSLDDYMGADTGIDWQYEAFRPTWSQSHDVSVIGGNADTQYSVSFSHFDEAGIFESNTFRKDNARVKFSQKIFRWLKLDASVNYTRSKDTGIGTGGSTLSNIIQYRPVGGLYVSDWHLRYNMVDQILEEVGLSTSN